MAARKVFAIVIAFGLIVFAGPGSAVINQVDGTVVPQNYTAQMQQCLDRSEGSGVLDAVFDADLQPEVYLPVPTVVIHFVVQAEGAGYRNSFGWYNVGDDVSNPANLHEIFPCRSTATCPCDSCDSSRWRHAYIDISAEAEYKGGYIGFYLITPETLTGGSNNDHCSGINIPEHRIYYTEKMLNDDGDYVHFIVYTSVTHTDAFYFGFEDLFRGGDNDFEDMLVLVDGLVPACIPREEVCDGADNDCDGEIDEGLTIPCSTACGDGVRTCVDGSYGPCSAPDPEPEVCDGVDNNCDGEIDEGLERGCSTICETGTEYCVMGVWTDCTARDPQPEVCNGIDDDCDGDTDEGNPGGGASCGTNTGACETGVETCIGGVIVCAGGIDPVPESCNAVDDDCDGEVDEGDPGGGEACGSDVGECESGVIHCVDGELQCVGEVGPSPELCNGLDDDCDGEADEGNPEGGAPCGVSTGECEPGIETCVDGSIICLGGTGPESETCDGLDNDCNGLIDDGDPGGGASCGTDVGECEAGVIHCVDGSLECVGEVGPGTETCNGLDDDCNGVVDNDDPGGGAPCGSDVGACVPGTIHCVGGALVCVGGVEPTSEICNGIDDDCDGEIDEGNPGGGLPCGNDEGECEPGITWCSSSEVEPPCTPPDPLPDPPEVLCLCEVGPEDEVCDCLDNDCNGLVDDNLPLGDPCGTDEGECKMGQMVCLDCEWQCSYDVGPSPEVCDCLDNDCNGLADDGDLCGEEGICVQGETSCYCALPCNPAQEFPCPSGKVCSEVEGYDGYYCINDPCEGVECPDCTQICVEGECVDKCDQMECGEGEVCTYFGCSARCVPMSCYVPEYACEEGERCEDGVCVPDPCYEVECGEDQFCRDGECYDACTVGDECPEGQVCHDGECVDDPCWDVECTEGRVCDPETGECVEDPCESMVCPSPQVCIDGRCTDDPCYFIECPEGFVCVGDTCVEEGMMEDDVAEEEADASSGPVYVTSTGGGGCAACAVTGSDGAPGGTPGGTAVMLAFLLLASIAAASRRRARRKDGRRGIVIPFLFFLLVAAAAAWGCHADYECVDNCDVMESPDARPDAEDAVEGADGFVDVEEDGDAEGDVEEEEIQCNPLAEEECNGVDDDCDGEVDEDFDLSSDPRNCGECGNVCNYPHAFAECLDGECVMTGCDINFYDCVPDDPEDPESLGCETLCRRTRDQDDICNNVDDNCNCAVDELIDKTSDPENCGECGVRCNPRNAVGACESSECVIEECNEGFWDLNGEYDDGCEYECSRCERTVGECEPGFTCCTSDGGETCNGVDDDCNGEIDEGNPEGGEDCGTDEGTCEFGTTQCTDGVLLCEGGVEPEEEVCDGDDNDCDGSVDEDDPGGGAPCGTDAGECSAGVEHCVDGAIVCEGEIEPEPELCNGLDDDCDGIVDDGNPEGGGSCGIDVGTCVSGTWKCVDGGLVCTGSIEPMPEICDGLDNNCDGVADEGNPEGGVACGTDVGECLPGITECIDGNLECTGDTPPSPERCNGLDDDCDGTADDGDPEGGGSCGTDVGLCSMGTVHCDSGVLVCQGETGPVPEECDGEDNDCDGEIDEGVSGEGLRCGTNRGTCEYGTTECVDGVMECIGGVDPVSPEPCDGLDNDCDGTIDNNLEAPGISCLSDGVCAGVSPSCDGSSGWSCHYPDEYQVSEIWCDGLDNDCDSITDEGCPLLDTSDIRLDTGDSAGAANSTQIDLATDGAGVVHAVYIDRRDGASDIYYNHSLDGGVSWMDPDLRLDTNGAGATNSVKPAVDHGIGSRAFTAWSDFRASSSYRDVYTVNSTNNGTSWSSPDGRIDTGLNTDSYGVDLAADALGNVYVVYENLLADRSRQIYLSRSPDSGATWEAPVRIDHNTISPPHIASEPRVAVDDAGGVFVVWRDNRHGNGAVYFNYSIDGGAVWQPADRRIETDSPAGNAHSGKPQIAADASGNVHVVWEDFRNGYADIFARSSNDGGASWIPSDVRLDADVFGHDSTNPVIAADDGGAAWVAWEDLRDGMSDIHLSMTADGGTTWLAEDVRVDTDGEGTSGSYLPSISARGSFVVVAWQDDRNGDFDIFMNYSLDGGALFQPLDFRVDRASGAWDAVGVQVVVESSRAHFVWVDYRNGSHMNGDIYALTLRP